MTSPARRRAIHAVPYPRFFSQHSGVGGHVAHLHGLLRGLVAAGFEVDALVEEEHEVLEMDGVRVTMLPMGSSGLAHRQLWGVRFVRALARLAREREPALCYMRYSAGSTPLIRLAARVLGAVPLVLEVNSLGSQRAVWMRPLDRLALRGARTLVCVSDTLSTFIVEEVDPGLAGRLVVVPNGVDVARFRVPAPPRPPGGGVRFGFAGLLKPDYGLEDLVDAHLLLRARRPEAELHLYGEGPLREPLRRRIRERGGDGAGVELHDPVPFLAMPGILAGLDALVYTTSRRYHFQSPIKLLEYMAAEKPIVAADTPQVRRLLDDGELGELYETEDVAGLAAAMETVLAAPDVARDKARRARESVAAAHTWGHRTTAILAAAGLDR